jgi:hypothetical protein
VKDAFAKKFFGAGRDSAGGALASVLRKHSTEGRTPDAVERCAAELVRRQVAMIATRSDGVFAAKAGTSTIPCDRISRMANGFIGAVQRTLMDFRSLGLFYNFECFLIFKFNGLVLGSGWS